MNIYQTWIITNINEHTDAHAIATTLFHELYLTFLNFFVCRSPSHNLHCLIGSTDWTQKEPYPIIVMTSVGHPRKTVVVILAVWLTSVTVCRLYDDPASATIVNIKKRYFRTASTFIFIIAHCDIPSHTSYDVEFVISSSTATRNAGPLTSLNGLMNFITYFPPVTPEGHAKRCILRRSMVFNPLGDNNR